MKRLTPLILTLPLVFGACSGHPEPDKQRVEDVIPITTANMRGHKALYDEGWFVVTSTKEAFAFAKERSVERSADAISRAAASIAERSGDYGEAVKGNVVHAAETGTGIFKTGTANTGAILGTTHAIASAQTEFAMEGFERAWDRFVKGNLYLGERTADERAELRNTFGTYFGNLSDDFSDIYDIAASLNGDFGQRISTMWDGAWDEAGKAFEAEYEESGESPNTLVALADILQGYAKSLYIGLVKPGSQTVAESVVTGGKNVGKVVFLPVAAATSVAGRTVQSVGLTLYYTTKTGIKIVSPTLEAGFLTGLSILSLGTTPVTYVTGASIGAVNQVAITAAAPVAAAGEGVITTTADTAKYVTFVAYDALSGATKVVFNQAASGVVLGYNALTAIPTHLVMGVGDAAFFLAWDGPNLVIAMAEGRVEGFGAGDLPVGTVVDLNKLQGQEGMKVKIISDDPAVIGKVLEQVPGDMRIKGE